MPGRATGHVAVGHELVSAGGRLKHGFGAVALHHQQRSPPDVDVGDQSKTAGTVLVAQALNRVRRRVGTGSPDHHPPHFHAFDSVEAPVALFCFSTSRRE